MIAFTGREDLMRIARVFPRQTKATPTDELAFVGSPDLFVEHEPSIDKVQISVTFTWDWPAAEKLAKEWERFAPVEIGGPATGAVAGDFEPGRFLKPGYTITSRGCPNHCWFCRAWRQGGPRELPIRDGWNVLDDNLLACSEQHIRDVFAMLRRNRQVRRVSFTGGLEAARLEDWHVDLLVGLSPRPALFFAYDTPDDYEPLREALQKVFAAGFTRASHRIRCYVLIGFPGDTLAAANHRLSEVFELEATPAAMLYRDTEGQRPSHDWRRLQRRWMRPAIIHAGAAS